MENIPGQGYDFFGVNSVKSDIKLPALESLTTNASNLWKDITKDISFDGIGKATDGFLKGVTGFVGGLFKKGGINSDDPSLNGRISSFVSTINNRGVAFNHLFYIQIHPTLSNSQNFSAVIPFFCAGTSLPSTNILSSGYREYGAQYEIPYGISNDPLTMTFYSDSGMNIKKFFDMWQSMIYDKNTNKLNFPDAYRWDIKVAVIDKTLKYNNDVYAVKFHKTFPKTISNIELDYSNVGIITFSVTFEYEKLEINSITAAQLSDEIVKSAVSNVKPYGNFEPSGKTFPLNVIQNTLGVAGEFMNKGVSAGVSAVKSIFGSSATATDDAAFNIRSITSSGKFI